MTQMEQGFARIDTDLLVRLVGIALNGMSRIRGRYSGQHMGRNGRRAR
jgi:hypothetical protein